MNRAFHIIAFQSSMGWVVVQQQYWGARITREFIVANYGVDELSAIRDGRELVEFFNRQPTLAEYEPDTLEVIR